MEKVVYIIGTMGRGGAESQLLKLMEGAKKAGLQPGLFLLEEQGDLLGEVRSLGIPVWAGGYDSRASRLRKIGLLIRCSVRLLRLLRLERPQVIHGFLPLANFFAAFCGRIAGIPCVVTSRRALNTHQDRVPGWRLIDIIGARLSHRIVANSNAVKSDTLSREGGKPERIQVIYNGISLAETKSPTEVNVQVRKELGLNPSDEVLLVVANLIPYKGHDELLQAVAMLRPDHPRVRVLVAGEDRGIGKILKERAKELGVSDVVFFLGLRRDVPRLLAAADIYVSPSHEEGFSNALLEALAAGKAVVATRVGGNPEMLEGGELGVLVEPRNVKELHSALDFLLRNPRARSELGEKAASLVKEKYAPSRMVQAYIQCYRRCLS